MEDDLDRELKLVQLQRERLALEREIASQRKGRAVKNATKSVVQSMTAFFEALGNFFTRWWKGIFAVVLATVFALGCIGVGVAWIEHKHRQAEADWGAAASEYATQKCGAIFVCDEVTFNCLQEKSRYSACTLRASAEYQNQVPRPRKPW